MSVITNSLGISGLNSSGTGIRGPPGRGVGNIVFDDNNDGSVSVTYQLTDGTDVGPFTGTLVSDDLVANKLSLEGTNNTNKFQVKDNSDNVILGVNTVSNNVLLPGLYPNLLLQTDDDSNLTASNVINQDILLSGITTSSTKLYVKKGLNTIFAIDNTTPALNLRLPICANTNNSSWQADGTNGYSMPTVNKWYYQLTTTSAYAANAQVGSTLLFPSGVSLTTLRSLSLSIYDQTNSFFVPQNSSGSANNFFVTANNTGILIIANDSVASATRTFHLWLESV